MKFLSFIIFLGLYQCYSQTKIFDQEFYAIQREVVVEFKQEKDSIFISRCINPKNCNYSRKISLFIEKDSLIENNTKIVFIKRGNQKSLNTMIPDDKIIILDYKNGRFGIKDSFTSNGKEKTHYIVIYPKSELDNLKPIEDISEQEAKDVAEKFKTYIKSVTNDEFELDDSIHWNKFNELVIKKGYSPIDAEKGIIKKLK
jgi:hypothetical protein